MASLDHSRQRIVYLIAYSRADTTKFSSKKGFSSAVVEAWQHFGIRVTQGLLASRYITTTMSGDEMNLYHYHIALKLAKWGRWLQVRNYLDEKFGVQVNFSDNHNLYYTAYRCVTKEDCGALHSSGHPDLTDAVPWTKAAKTSRKRKAKDKDKGQGKK